MTKSMKGKSTLLFVFFFFEIDTLKGGKHICETRNKNGQPKVGLCSPLAMLDGSRFSCHATIIEHDMKLMSIAKK